MTSILCVTPCVKLGPETIRSIFTQTYPGPIDHFLTRRNDPALYSLNIVAAYQRIRAVFLAEPAYTHLMIIEDDMIIPPDALEKLLAVDADIAYGVYCFRRGTPVVNVTHPDTTNTYTDRPAEWRKQFKAGAVVDCGGLGFGCTLLKRHVLERLPMRSENGGGDADTCLAHDARAAGMSQRAHLGVVCGHKHSDGCVIWPAAERPFYETFGVSVPKLAHVKAVRGFALWEEHGMPKVIMAGESATIDFDVAQQLALSGQAEIL